MSDRIQVLYVDDDPDTRTETAEHLEGAGDQIDVRPVTTPEEAFERIATEAVDCVLSDYRLSSMSGLEFLSKVRDRWPELPFILHLGNGSEAITDADISDDVTDYVRKTSTTTDYVLLAQRITALTEQRRAAEYERIADLVREVQTALVRARTRAEVDSAVCERLADADPYVFAWIGTVDAANDRLTPQASSGRDAGYLEDVEITADDSATGRGPTGKAVRSRSIQVTRDIAEDSSYDPWRDDALEHGYRSSAAVPIEYEGTLYGVLNVYSDRRGAFDADEQSLLHDLCEAIAHAYYRVRIQEQYESQYQKLFEDAPVMMAFTRNEDGEPIIEDCNRRFADRLGYSPAELRGRPLAELYTEESAQQLLDQDGYERALEGEFAPQERGFITAEGERLITLLQATPRRDADGEIVGTHALYVDVTERKRAQEVLQQAEAMEASMDGMAILDENEEYIYVNQAHADSYGYDDPDDLIGNTWRMLYKDDEIERFEEEIFPVLDETGEWRGEATGLRADGTTFPQELSLTWFGGGGIVCVVRDITERTEREREHQELQREYETFFENVQDALFLLDVDEEETIRFQRFNKREEAFTGKSTEDVRGKTPTEAFGEDLGAELEANYRECLDRQETIVYEEELPIGGETTVWQTKLTPIVVDGQVERIVGSGREITELKQYERELERKNDLFERAQKIADLGAWEVDLRTDEVWWTEQVSRIYGLSADYDLEPSEAIEYFHPEDQSTIQTAYERAVEDGESYDLELRVVGDDGTTRWVRVRGESHLEDGDVVRVRGTMQDITERKERERELERAHERLRVLFNEAPDAIAIHDADGNVLDANQATVEYLGYSREELLSMKISEFDVDHTIDELREHWAEMEIGNTVEIESRHERKDGSTYPVEVWVTKLEVHDTPQYLALVRDITERKEHERELQQFQEAVEQTAHAVYITDTDGTIEYVNPAFEKITGYNEEDAIGRTPEILSSGAYGDEFYEEFWRTINSGERWESEMVDERVDGEKIVLHQTISPITDDDGNTRKIVAVAQDITDRKKYEETLEQAREELRQLIDLVPDLIAAKNRNGEFILANEATAEAYGLTPEEIEGRKESAVIPNAEDAEKFREDDLAVLESGESKTIPEEELTTADGETIILQTTKIPYEVPGSGEDAVLAYARDVTELKQYERELETQRDNLEVLNQVVRHDIRNDMAVVHGRADLLEEHVEEEGREDLDAVLRATEDAIELTTMARDLSKTMLSTEEDVEPVQLTTHLQAPIEKARSDFDNAVVTIEGELPDIRVRGNELLEAVFRNLIQNAIIHNDTETPTVHISTTLETETVTVAVADNGPGIPDDQKETIFGKGEKGLDSPGTGLGLYLVRTLVEQYGGDVWVEDNDPEGSIFYVELPRGGE